MDRIPDQAAHLRIRDLDGNEHELAEVWAAKTIVLIFLRHFG